MKSYTQSIALLNSMTKVPSTDTTTTTLLSQLWNDSVRTVCSIRSGKWWFLQDKVQVQTVASQGDYAIPARIRKIVDIYVTVGTTVYVPLPVYSPEMWNNILSAQLGDSDVPMFYFVNSNNSISIQPKPSSNTGIIHFRGRKDVADLTIADVTNLTVTTATTDSTTIVMSGGVLASFAGRWIRITLTGAANTGDGYWYEISSADTGTNTITLVAPYKGTSIVAGTAACTISQMSPIPDAYDMAPIYRTLALFYHINDPLHPEVANRYWRLYDGGQEAGLSSLVGGLVGQMLENEGESIEGAYVPPTRSLDNAAQWPPYWLPYQDASGF